ncbi:MAG: outer rane lipoproteinsorting protein [Flavipsychrobacter sp.]|nr:outer rane lipoproteinsorting protein [Flavipsychrobacter sp.]
MNIVKQIATAVMILAAGAAQAQTADEIIQKHIDAIGGKKWDNIHSMKMSGGLSVQGMEVSMSQTVEDNKGMRMDLSILGNNCYTIITPKEGWVYMPIQPGMDKVTPMTEDELKMSQYKLNVRGVQIADKSLISKSDYLGIDSVNGVACYKVKVADKGGNLQTAYFDTKNYYLVRSESLVKIQDQEQEMGIDFSNFKTLPEGITMAMVWGTPQGDVTLKSIEVNKKYDDAIFKPGK